MVLLLDIFTIIDIGGKLHKSKFRINSEELTCSLIQMHKSFNWRNLYIWAKQLLPVVASWEESTPLPGQGLFCIGVHSHLDHQKEQRVPNLTDNIRQLSHSIQLLTSFLGTWCLSLCSIPLFWVVNHSWGYRELRVQHFPDVSAAGAILHLSEYHNWSYLSKLLNILF